MSKEVQIVAWCDGDHEEPERAVVERNLSVDSEPYIVDLCEPCDKAVQDVRVLMLRGIRADKVTPPKPPRKKKSPAPEVVEPVGKPSRVVSEEAILSRREKDEAAGKHRTDCQEPGCVDERTGRPYVAPTRSALGQHLKHKHGTLLSDYDWTA